MQLYAQADVKDIATIQDNACKYTPTIDPRMQCNISCILYDDCTAYITIRIGIVLFIH